MPKEHNYEDKSMHVGYIGYIIEIVPTELLRQKLMTYIQDISLILLSILEKMKLAH